jgi:lipopolysaccharide export system protein LptA
MEGNLTSERYSVRGNVVLRSDPSVDTALSGTESDQPLTLTADRLDVDRKTKRYLARGAVHFVQGTREGSCEKATLDDASHDLDLTGNARVSDAGQTLAAQTIHYNTQTRKFSGSGNVTILAPLPTPTPLPPGYTPPPAPKKRRLPGLPI